MDTAAIVEALSAARRAKLAQICQDCAAALDVIATIIVGCRNCHLREAQDPWVAMESQAADYRLTIN